VNTTKKTLAFQIEFPKIVSEICMGNMSTIESDSNAATTTAADTLDDTLDEKVYDSPATADDLSLKIIVDDEKEQKTNTAADNKPTAVGGVFDSNHEVSASASSKEASNKEASMKEIFIKEFSSKEAEAMIYVSLKSRPKYNKPDPCQIFLSKRVGGCSSVCQVWREYTSVRHKWGNFSLEMMAGAPESSDSGWTIDELVYACSKCGGNETVHSTLNFK